MPYVTSWERGAMLRLLERQLREKFGAEGLELVSQIRELKDAEQYLRLGQIIATATSLEPVRRACAEAAAPAARPRRGGGRGRRPQA